MGPPGLPGKRGQRVGHCVFGLGVLAALRCVLRAGAAGRALPCAALPCLQGIMCPLLPLALLVKCVCVFPLAGGGGWGQAGQHEMPGM